MSQFTRSGLPVLCRGAIGLILFFTFSASYAALFARTVDNLQREVEAARAEGKKLAVAFTLPDCPGCQEMERAVYPDMRTEKKFGRSFRTVRLDISRTEPITDALGASTVPADLAKRLRAIGTPSFAFFAGDGSFLYRHTGTLDRAGLRKLGDYVARAEFEKFPFGSRSEVGGKADARQARESALLAAPPRGNLPLYPEFTLQSTDGREHRLADFRGQVVALAVGYTRCPDVCPTTLVELKSAVEALPPARRRGIQILFATLDPERDSLSILREYAAAFRPDGGRAILGLRGDPGATASLIGQLQLVAEKQPSESMGYSLDHTADVFLFDAGGRLRGLSPYGQSVAQRSHDLVLLLGDVSRQSSAGQKISRVN